MRPGRLTAGVVAAGALALAGAASSTAHVQHHQRAVVKRSALRLTAWDSRTAARGVCFRLRSGTRTSARCDRSGKHSLRLAYTSFVDTNGSATLLGGIARRGEATVTATFADGRTRRLRTLRSRHYRGRQRRRARFWAGRVADATALRTLVAKNRHGHVLETIDVSPAPAPTPAPPGPCPPCPGPPRAIASQTACPQQPCPL